MTDFMVNRSCFFIFGPGFHWLLFEFWVVFTKMVADKIETLVVFIEGKKKGTTWWSWLGPRAGAEARGPSQDHQGVSFFFCLPWIPPKFQFFLPPFSWIPPKIQTIINEIQGKKKIWAVYHEIRHWWYFGPIWVFICYWIRLRFNVNLITIIFYSWTTCTVLLERKVHSIKSDGYFYYKVCLNIMLIR